MIKNFIIKKINKDILKNLNYKIKTRFAPEPSGILHLGHLKCIYINKKIKNIYKGIFFLRIDDTNVSKKKLFFCKKIIDFLKKFKIDYYYYSSNKFKKLYIFSKKIIKYKKSYIDSQKIKVFKINKGNYKILGKKSIFIYRTTKENLYLFKNMKNFKFNNYEITLRIKLNYKSSFFFLRDPIIFRIIEKKLCPLYDFCNSILDRMDKVTHSICTKEFENNKILYNFYIKLYNKINKKKFFPFQIEFSKLLIKNFNLSKRKINKNIKKKKIKYNDVRLLTIEGLIKRGIKLRILINFIKKTDYSKKNSIYNINILKNEIKLYYKKIRKKNFYKKNFFIIKKKKILCFLLKKKFFIKKKKKGFFKIIYIKKKSFIIYKNFKIKKKKYFINIMKIKKITNFYNLGIFKYFNKKFFEIIKNKPGFV
ncbi:glutamate--tRNA ligase family protein [Candidatus Vidania fulgoroideorum]